MACAQTGSGKTGAMLIPMINYLISSNHINPRGGPSQEVKGVIVAPTRELATQEMVVFFFTKLEHFDNGTYSAFQLEQDKLICLKSFKRETGESCRINSIIQSKFILVKFAPARTITVIKATMSDP